MEADPLRLKQALINLISNAIKYNNPNGSVAVSFAEIIDGKIRIGVRDNGHGIPDDKKARIFKPFERFDVDSSIIEGTGIGLTISKRLIEMMDGTLGFESQVGKGSFFYIDLPVSDKTPATEPIRESPVEKKYPATKTGKKILYIEDIAANANW